MGSLIGSLKNATAIRASARTWRTAPAADNRAPRTHGGEGAADSGTDVTTWKRPEIITIFYLFYKNL